MKFMYLLFIVLCALMLSGCFLTKVVTVPMRLGGAVISIIPIAGNTAHDAIDSVADVVDEVPL